MPELVRSITAIATKEYDTTTTLGNLFPLSVQGNFILTLRLDLDGTNTDRFDIVTKLIVEAPETATLNVSHSCSAVLV